MTIETGTEIEILPARRPLQTQALGQLMEHAQAMGAAKLLGDALAATDMVPADYKGKPGNAAAAILFGAELGLNPIQSLQQIFVISGKPAIYARTAVALVMRCGIKVETIETSDASVTVRATDPHSGQVEQSTWDTARAVKAKYNNPKYNSDPQAMLYAKAAMEVCRKIAPDVLLGIPMSREELELEQQPAPRKVASTRRGVEGLRAQISHHPEVSAMLDVAGSEVIDEAALIDFGDQADHVNEIGVTGPQLKKLAILRQRAGYEDDAEGRADWFGLVSATINREIVDSNKGLTKSEAGKIIDTLENPAR